MKLNLRDRTVACIQNFVGKPGGKRPLRRPRRGWEDNVKIYVEEIRCVGCVVDSSGSTLGVYLLTSRATFSF